jgi:hypothetical protein
LLLFSVPTAYYAIAFFACGIVLSTPFTALQIGFNDAAEKVEA